LIEQTFCLKLAWQADSEILHRERPIMAAVSMWIVWGLVLPSLLGQQESTATGDPAESEQSGAFHKLAFAAATGYEIELATEPATRLKLKEEPVLRWTNPVQSDGAGEVYVWTDRGRPEAVVSIYRFVPASGKPGLHHEFHSLSETRLSARGASGRTWSPEQAGLEFQRVPDAAAPASSPAARRRQMRDIAEQFQADKTDRQGDKRTLRLLTQPLYRYEPTRDDVLDGALFAFVEGTDPEVLLLVEARQTGERHQWEYALSRLNSVRLQAKYKDRSVWDQPLIEYREYTRRDRPYSVFNIPQP